MSRWKKFYDSALWRHLGLIASISIFLLIAAFFSLDLYTRHGETQPLPDFTGLTEAQLQHLIKSSNLRYTIIDSVHIDEVPKGVVIEQVPKAGELVKKNRTLFFTINAWTQEQVPVPNLTDYSLRNAREILESFSLRVGELVYIPSEYANLVLGQHLNGKPVHPGTMLPKGTAIDLLVGRGLTQESTAIPSLFALNLEEARRVAQGIHLNIGAAVFDSDIRSHEDSISAKVWKQNPPANRGFNLQLGASIDIWLTLDQSLLNQEDEQTDDLNSDFENEFK